MVSPSLQPPELTPEPDLDFSGRGKLFVCSSGLGDDGDTARIDHSLNISWQSIPFNIITSTSLPGSLCNNSCPNRPTTTKVPSRVTPDVHQAPPCSLPRRGPGSGSHPPYPRPHLFAGARLNPSLCKHAPRSLTVSPPRRDDCSCTRPPPCRSLMVPLGS